MDIWKMQGNCLLTYMTSTTRFKCTYCSKELSFERIPILNTSSYMYMCIIAYVYLRGCSLSFAKEKSKLLSLFSNPKTMFPLDQILANLIPVAVQCSSAARIGPHHWGLRTGVVPSGEKHWHQCSSTVQHCQSRVIKVLLSVLSLAAMMSWSLSWVTAIH